MGKSRFAPGVLLDLASVSHLSPEFILRLVDNSDR